MRNQKGLSHIILPHPVKRLHFKRELYFEFNSRSFQRISILAKCLLRHKTFQSDYTFLVTFLRIRIGEIHGVFIANKLEI